MTIERAIEILDPEHREHYDDLEEVNTACRMGAQALSLLAWIPVKERHPEDGEPVLGVCTAKLEDGGEWLDRDLCVVVYQELTDEWTVLDDTDCQPVEVSHWMPLPEPPEETP